MRFSLMISALVVVACSLGGPLNAATGSSERRVVTDESHPIETIVVTAQKREQDVQKVPMAVSAFGAAERDILGIQTAQAIANFTPSASIAEDPARVNIRGIGRYTEAAGGSDVGVGIYVDGVYTSDPALLNFSSPMTIERIEVLRGPQGTLYGRNTIGGAVNIITKRPTLAFSGEARTSYESYERSKTEFTVSGPITDSFRYRLIGSYVHQGEGYVENLSGKDEGVGTLARDGQVQLEWDATESLNVWLKASHGEKDLTMRDGNLITPYQTSALFLPSLPLVPNAVYGYDVPNPGVKDSFKKRDNVHGSVESQSTNITSHVTLDFGGSTLRYVGSWAEADRDLLGDLDQSDRESFVLREPTPPEQDILVGAGLGPANFCSVDPAGCFISAGNEFATLADVESYSNELNLLSDDWEGMSWIVGLYQARTDVEVQSRLMRPDQPELVNPDHPNGEFLHNESARVQETYAVFGQTEIDLTEQFRLQAGLRYTRDKRQTESTVKSVVSWDPNRLYFGGLVDLRYLPLVTDAFSETSASFDHTTGRVALEWQPNENTNLFALIATGYKSGGITQSSPPVVLLDPEKLTSYEVGVKKMFGREWRVNLGAYYYDYEDAHVPTSAVILPNPSPTGILVNAPVTSYGFEAEVHWSPTVAWQSNLVYSYLNARFGDFCAIDNNFQDLNGNGISNEGIGPPLQCGDPTDDVHELDDSRVPQSPEHKVAFSLAHTAIFDAGLLTLAGTYAYNAGQRYDIFPNPVYRGNSYSTVDLRATWSSHAETYSVVAYVNNALDEESYNAVQYLVGGRDVNLNKPRTVGAELRFRW